MVDGLVVGFVQKEYSLQKPEGIIDDKLSKLLFPPKIHNNTKLVG